ncbi:hypothetical protein BDZ91DRAFT_789387 [Kalaharituber pfeilii]|nr:hypothetical protein BDZ91DRAFT_789387 [Kalaharituber pfeilii]
MVTKKDEISNSKALLGWGDKDAEYTAWRSKRQAGEDKLEDEAKRMVGFKRSAKTLLARNDDRAYEAFKALLIDACKKRRETEQKLRLAVAEQKLQEGQLGLLHSTTWKRAKGVV